MQKVSSCWAILSSAAMTSFFPLCPRGTASPASGPMTIFQLFQSSTSLNWTSWPESCASFSMMRPARPSWRVGEGMHRAGRFRFVFSIPFSMPASVPGGRDIVQNPPGLPASRRGYMRIHGYDQCGPGPPKKPPNPPEKRFSPSLCRVDICVFPDIVSGSHVPA